MPSLAEIAKDPNYVNANAATKAAIFERYSAQDQNYTGANEATKVAIRQRFGLVEAAKAAEAPPADGLGKRLAKGARHLLGPTVEALATAGGAVAGATLGPVGAVVGGGLGYGIGTSALRAVDTLLGTAPPETAGDALVRGANDVALGTAGGAVGHVAAPLIAKGAGRVTDIVTGKAGKVDAAGIARKAAGDKIQIIKNLNAKAPSNVTAGQAAVQAERTPYAALSEMAARRDSSDTFFGLSQSQEATRNALLRKVTPDLKAAEGARAGAAQPFYAKSDATTIAVDSEIEALFARMPKGTLERAAEIARIEGKTFQIGQNVPARTVDTGFLDQSGRAIKQQVPAEQASITGESLHYLKRALSDIAFPQSAQQGIGRDAQRAATGLLDDFLSAFERKIPAYGQGRETFARLSEPVNQSLVLNRMQGVIDAPGGGERVTPFLNAMNTGEEALLKRATGSPRFKELADVLNVNQMGAVNRISGELTRDAQLGTQAAAGRGALEEILRRDTIRLRLPALFSRTVTISNKGLDVLEQRIGRKTMDALTEGMKSAKSSTELLNTLPASERVKILKFMSQPENFSPAGRALTVNSMAPPSSTEYNQ